MPRDPYAAGLSYSTTRRFGPGGAAGHGTRGGAGLTAGSARAARALQRSKDPGGQLGGATAVDQLENGVEINAAVGGEIGGEHGREARSKQPIAAPLGDFR